MEACQGRPELRSQQRTNATVPAGMGNGIPYIWAFMIAFLTLELRIEAAHSLKDKRQVTRSLKDRLRASFNVAVAELDPSLLWNQATIGVVSVSHSRDYLDGLMKNVERAAMRIANNAGAEITDSFVEFL
jgi:uncharacterized protein YlxP (DUF503 family)